MGSNSRNLTILDAERLASKSQPIVTPRTHTDKAIRLDQAQLAQEFAEQISVGRLAQVAELLQQNAQGLLHSVEAIYKIREIVNRKD